MEEEEEEIVGSDFVGSDDEDKSVEALELKLKKILEEKEQLERKKKREELLAKIKQAKAEVSSLNESLQPTQQEIDKWTEDELRDFFKVKGITLKDKSLQHLRTLAKSVSEANLPDFKVTFPPSVDRMTVKLDGNSRTFPNINDISLSNWSKELSSLPSIDHVVAHSYILSSADYDVERFKNLRQEEAYILFKGSSVRNVKMHDLDGGYAYVKSCCYSGSNDATKSEDVWSLVQDNGSIQSAGCSCSGDTGCCKHVVALLLTLASVNKTNAPIHNVSTTKIEERLPKAAPIEHDMKTHRDTKPKVETNRGILQPRKHVTEKDNSEDSEGEPEIWIPPKEITVQRIEELSTHEIDSHAQAEDTKTEDFFIPSMSIRGISAVDKTLAKSNTSDIVRQIKNKPKDITDKQYSMLDTDKMAFKQTGRTQNTTKCPSTEEQYSELNTKIKQNLKELKMSNSSLLTPNQEIQSRRTTENHVTVKTPSKASIRSDTSDTSPLLTSSSIRPDIIVREVSSIDSAVRHASKMELYSQQKEMAYDRIKVSTVSGPFVPATTPKTEVNINLKQTGPALRQEQVNQMSASLPSNIGPCIEPLQYPHASNIPYYSSPYPTPYPSTTAKMDSQSSTVRPVSGIPATIQHSPENTSIGKSLTSSQIMYPRLVYPSLEANDRCQKNSKPSSVMSIGPQVYSGTSDLVKPFTSPGLTYPDITQSPTSRLVYPEVYTDSSSRNTIESSSGMPASSQNLSRHVSIEMPSVCFLKEYPVDSQTLASRLKNPSVIESELSQKTAPLSSVGLVNKQISKNSPLIKPLATPRMVYPGTSQSSASCLVYPGVTTDAVRKHIAAPSSGISMSTDKSSYNNLIETPYRSCGMDSRSLSSRLGYVPIVKSEISQTTVHQSPGTQVTTKINSDSITGSKPFVSSCTAFQNNSQTTASMVQNNTLDTSGSSTMDTSESSQSVPRFFSRMPDSNTLATSHDSSRGSQVYVGYDQLRVGQLDLINTEQKLQTETLQDASQIQDSTRPKVNRRDRFKSTLSSTHPVTLEDAIPTQIPLPDDIPQMRITYDRTFLLKLRKSTFAKTKPDISHLPEIMVEYEDGDTQTVNTPFSSNVGAGYVKGAQKKVVTSGVIIKQAVKCKKHRQDRSNSPKPARPDDMHRSPHKLKSPKPQHGQIDMNAGGLQMVEAVAGSAGQDLASTDDIMRKAIAAFNMLKNGYDSAMVVDTISSLTINTEDCLNRIVSFVVETVIDEPGLTSVCSSICRILARAKVPSKDGLLTFSMTYRQKCENEIELGILSRSEESYQGRIEELTRFTVSISRMMLLKPCDIHLILMKLYLTGSEHCLVCFCSLLLDVWNRMERCTSQNYISLYSDIIEEIQSKEQTEALKYKISQLKRKQAAV